MLEDLEELLEEMGNKWHKLLKILKKKGIIDSNDQDNLELESRKQYEMERAWNN